MTKHGLVFSVGRLIPLLGVSLIISLVGSGCAGSGSPSAAALTEKLASSDRSSAEKARDVHRQPGEVLTFLGVEPGMTALDLIAAAGYYTEALAVAVGPEGKVYAQNNAYVLQMRDGANDKAMTRRFEGGRLPNVERLDREMSDLGLEPGSVDVALTALNFHDIYNGRGQDAASTFLATVYGVLKPGGVLGLIDHDGNPRRNNAELHRIPVADVEAAIEASPFVLEASSDALRHATDDHSRNVFDPAVRGKTDRFVLLLRKPR